MVWYFYIKVNYKLQSERRLRSLMVRCEQCGVLIKSIPFKCKYCGYLFCEKHRIPESHICTSIQRNSGAIPEPLKRSGVYYKDHYIKNPIAESDEGGGIPNWILPVGIIVIMIIVLSVLFSNL